MFRLHKETLFIIQLGYALYPLHSFDTIFYWRSYQVLANQTGWVILCRGNACFNIIVIFGDSVLIIINHLNHKLNTMVRNLTHLNIQ